MEKSAKWKWDALEFVNKIDKFLFKISEFSYLLCF